MRKKTSEFFFSFCPSLFLLLSPTHPQPQTTHQNTTHPFVRGLPEPVDPPQVVQRHAVPREEAPVHDQRAAASAPALAPTASAAAAAAPDDVPQRQRAKGLAEEVGQQPPVLGAHLAVEAVYAVHPGRLVVAARQVQARREQALVREERQDDLGGEGAPVDKVAVEEVGVFVGGRAPGEGEDVEEVIELAVDVAADLFCCCCVCVCVCGRVGLKKKERKKK